MLQSLQPEQDLNTLFEEFGVGEGEPARVLYNAGGLNKQQVTQYLLKRSQRTGLTPERMDTLLGMMEIDGLEDIIGRDGKVYTKRQQLEAAIGLREEVGVDIAQQVLKQTRMFAGPEALSALEEKIGVIRSIWQGPLGVEKQPRELSDSDWAVMDALGVNRKNIQNYEADDIISRREVLDAIAQIEFPVLGDLAPYSPFGKSFERWRSGTKAKKDDDKALDVVYHKTFDLQFNRETGRVNPLYARRVARANKLSATAPSFRAADKLLDYAFGEESIEDVIRDIQNRMKAGTFELPAQEGAWLIKTLPKVYGKRERK